MQELENHQKILNTVFDANKVQIKSVAKSGKKQFLQYYIDNNKIDDLLPIQVILNSVFDRQTASICISGNSTSTDDNQGTFSLSDYSGNISLKDSNGNNILTVNQNGIQLGSSLYSLSINVSDILLNGNQINTPNGLVSLNSNGKLNQDIIQLSFDPQNLTVVQDLSNLNADNTRITIKLEDGSYKAATLQQLVQLCQPQMIIME